MAAKKEKRSKLICFSELIESNKAAESDIVNLVQYRCCNKLTRRESSLFMMLYTRALKCFRTGLCRLTK